MHKTIQALAFSSALFAGAAAAQAQGYTTNFNNTPPYTNNDYLSDGESTDGTTSTGSGQDNWLTTDPYNTNSNAPEYVGGSDYVSSANVGTYPAFSGLAASIGGNIRTILAPSTIVPGAVNPSVYHTFTPFAQSYQLNVDFVVNVQGNNPTTSTDSFAFSLRNTVGAPVLTLNITPSAATSNDNLGIALGTGANVRSVDGVNVNGSFHLTIQINPTAGTYSATYTSNLAAGGGAVVATGALANATTIAQVAAVWNLAGTPTKDGNGGYSSASTDALLFDNLSITAVVPEPSTYAMLGLGLVALVGLHKLRRRA